MTYEWVGTNLVQWSSPLRVPQAPTATRLALIALANAGLRPVKAPCLGAAGAAGAAVQGLGRPHVRVGGDERPDVLVDLLGQHNIASAVFRHAALGRFVAVHDLEPQV